MAGSKPEGGLLPMLTNSGDQTKNQVVLHVEHPTNPYRILCSRSETPWSIWIGLPGLTTSPFWLAHHYNIVLPIITGRLGKYQQRIELAGHTHDHNHLILHHHSGPTGLCPVPQEHTEEEVEPPPPTEPHNVADPHAVAKVHTVTHDGAI